eukprot:31036-Pelagococcus_subviridis.AAC.8
MEAGGGAGGRRAVRGVARASLLTLPSVTSRPLTAASDAPLARSRPSIASRRPRSARPRRVVGPAPASRAPSRGPALASRQVSTREDR